ncbi:MAG: FlgD immunoglobulin-like domain containing protein, partial [Calditrichota bacterium]
IILQVKSTNPTSANTLGSATIDIEYDETEVTYVNSNNWAFGFAQGYSRSATNNSSSGNSFVRILVTGIGVNENGGADPPGFDVSTDFTTWVQVNFSIINTNSTTSLTIRPGSNAIGFFENSQNEPNTGVINNQTLSSTAGIDDEPLPVSLGSFSAQSLQDGIVLNWATESEANNLGFDVLRSNNENEGYEIISSYQNNTELEGQGNSLVRNEYAYTDQWVIEGETYWYRLVDIDFTGIRTEHPPLSIKYSADVNPVTSDIPTRYQLYPNYPNPFNPETILRFDIPLLEDGPQPTRLTIYNNLGQLVRKLYNGSPGAGSFEITWDGRTEAGTSLPSGIYYAVMNSGSYKNTIKMLLIR